jgi:phospholipase/carboxylesterase
MNPMLNRTVLIALLCACLALPALTQEATGVAADTENPCVVLDPMAPDAGDFLDTDLRDLGRKAYEAYQAGEYDTAAARYLELLCRDITDAGSIYNLACCYGLMGEPELAGTYLKRSFKAGFDDIEHAQQDPDFANVRGKEVFDTVVDSIAAAFEQKKSMLGQTVWIRQPSYLPCHVRVPEAFDPEQEHVLVLGLHGYGSNPESFVGLWDRFENPDFIYAALQAPYPFSVGSELGYSWTMRLEDEELEKKARLMSESYVIETVRELARKYKVSGVYLLGFSQGCGMAYATGIKNHNLLKGIICFAGWLDTAWLGMTAMQEAKDLRVFIAHGKDDHVIGLEVGAKARDELKNLGYDVTFFEFAGAHQVPAEPLRKAQLWMKQ